MPLPQLHRDWAHPCHICIGTGLIPPHLRRDWARPCHICIGTGLAPATSAPGQGYTLPSAVHASVRARGRVLCTQSLAGGMGACRAFADEQGHTTSTDNANKATDTPTEGTDYVQCRVLGASGFHPWPRPYYSLRAWSLFIRKDALGRGTPPHCWQLRRALLCLPNHPVAVQMWQG